jgi:hypothetical protein
MNTFPPRHSKKDDDKGLLLAKESDPLLSVQSSTTYTQQRGNTIRSRRSPVQTSVSTVRSVPSIRPTPTTAMSIANEAAAKDPMLEESSSEGGATDASTTALHAAAGETRTSSSNQFRGGYQSISDGTPEELDIPSASVNALDTIDPTPPPPTAATSDVPTALRMQRIPSEASSSSASSTSAPKSSLLQHHSQPSAPSTAVPTPMVPPNFHGGGTTGSISQRGGSGSRHTASRSDYGHDDTDTIDEAPPLLEIPEEIYAVRKAALQVLKPLNKTWVRDGIRCAISFCFRTTPDLCFHVSIFSLGRYISWLCSYGALWYGSVDALAPSCSVLVHSSTVLVRARGLVVAACALRQGSVCLYCGSQ